jgi:hypothetical protein
MDNLIVSDGDEVSTGSGSDLIIHESKLRRPDGLELCFGILLGYFGIVHYCLKVN